MKRFLRIAYGAAGLLTLAIGLLGLALLTGLLVHAQPALSVLTAGTNTTSVTAETLATSQTIDEVIVQNDPENTVDIFVGNATAQPIQLAPGQSITVPVDNIATVYIKGDSGTPVVNYLARYRFRP